MTIQEFVPVLGLEHEIFSAQGSVQRRLLIGCSGLRAVNIMSPQAFRVVLSIAVPRGAVSREMGD